MAASVVLSLATSSTRSLTAQNSTRTGRLANLGTWGLQNLITQLGKLSVSSRTACLGPLSLDGIGTCNLLHSGMLWLLSNNRVERMVSNIISTPTPRTVSNLAPIIDCTGCSGIGVRRVGLGLSILIYRSSINEDQHSTIRDSPRPAKPGGQAGGSGKSQVRRPRRPFFPDAGAAGGRCIYRRKERQRRPRGR